MNVVALLVFARLVLISAASSTHLHRSSLAALSAARSLGLPPMRTTFVVWGEPPGSLVSKGKDLMLLSGRGTLGDTAVSVADAGGFCEGGAGTTSSEPGPIEGLTIILPTWNVSADLRHPLSGDCLGRAVRGSLFYSMMVILVLQEERGTGMVEEGGDLLTLLLDGTGPDSGLLLLRTSSTGDAAYWTVGEAYKVGETIVEQDLMKLSIDNPVGTFSSTKPSESSFAWKRRSDLRGRTVTAITKNWPPFVVSVQVNEGGLAEPSGFYPEILQSLANRLNFSVSATPAKQSQKWGDLVEIVSGGGEVEVGLTGFSQTSARAKLVDFSPAFTSSSIRLFYKRHKRDASWLIYLRSFLTPSWAAVGASVCACAAGLAAVSLSAASLSLESEEDAFGAVAAAAFAGLAFLGRRFPREPKDSATRITFASISFIGFACVSLYRSMLSASLAIQIESPPVRDLPELMDGEHSVMVSMGTSVEKYFSDSPPGSLHRELFDRKIVVPVNSSDLIMFDNIAYDYNYVDHLLFGVFLPLTSEPEYPCSVSTVPRDYRRVGNGLVFAKGWSLTPIFNYHLLKLVEEGVVGELRGKWMPRRDPSSSACSLTALGERKVQADLGQVVTVFLLFGAGATFAAAVFAAEKLALSLRERKPAQKI